MEEDNIIFEEIKSSPDGMKWDIPKSSEALRPKVVPGRYASLYAELKAKCNPERFMAQYDHDRILIANDIYTLACANADNIDTLKLLRARAMKDLNIKFSTKKIYELLTSGLRPSRYTGTDKFGEANDLYQEVISHADDIEYLEKLYEKTKDSYVFAVVEPPQEVNYGLVWLAVITISLVSIIFIVLASVH